MVVTTESLATILFRILNKSAALKTALGGSIYKGGFRPADSAKDDIGVNVIAVTKDNPQVAVANVNIYVADIQQSFSGKLNNVPDYNRLIDLTLLVTSAIDEGLKDTEFKDCGFHILDDRTDQNNANRPEHYKNIRLRFIIPK